MAGLDWVFVVVLAGSLVLGAWRGLVYELLSVANWVVAFVAAQWFAPVVAQWLPMGGASDAVRYPAGFVVVMVAALFAGGLLAWLAKKLVQAVGLRPVDRTLGAAFGLVRGTVMLLAMAAVINMTPLRNGSWWTESMGAGVSTAALKGLKPVLPDRLGQYLPG